MKELKVCGALAGIFLWAVCSIGPMVYSITEILHDGQVHLFGIVGFINFFIGFWLLLRLNRT